MNATLKAIVNVAATAALTLLILRWIAWIPGEGTLAGYLIDTAAWRGLRAADAWLRLSLGATVGPESDEMMLVWVSLGVSFAVAVGLVWGANRLLRQITRPRHSVRASRPQGAIS